MNYRTEFVCRRDECDFRRRTTADDPPLPGSCPECGGEVERTEGET